VRNKILIILFIISILTLLFAAMTVESGSYGHVIAAIISGTYACLFGGANFGCRKSV
jgi:hypothetical protein